MAAFLNRWLLISVIPLWFYSPDAGKEKPLYHPFHISVVEINHNAADKTFEISCKLFTDDFEKALIQNYKAKVDLINPPDRKAMDTLIKRYITAHLSIKADGRAVQYTYLGFEHENDAVYGYMQVDNIPSVKTITISNRILHDLFTDEINMMHITVGGNRKSTKLDYPATEASFSF